MKVFVSGQIADLEKVRSIQQCLRDAGHRITHDWTRNETGDKMLATPADKLRNPQEASFRAESDIKGVIESDVYIICTDNIEPGKGMYVELGAALALHETSTKPRIYLLGNMNHMSVFYFHPAIRRIESVGQLLDDLLSLRSE